MFALVACLVALVVYKSSNNERLYFDDAARIAAMTPDLLFMSLQIIRIQVKYPFSEVLVQNMTADLRTE